MSCTQEVRGASLFGGPFDFTEYFLQPLKRCGVASDPRHYHCKRERQRILVVAVVVSLSLTKAVNLTGYCSKSNVAACSPLLNPSPSLVTHARQLADKSYELRYSLSSADKQSYIPNRAAKLHLRMERQEHVIPETCLPVFTPQVSLTEAGPSALNWCKLYLSGKTWIC